MTDQSEVERVKEFKCKLKSLMDEYGAHFTADDYYQGYPECGQDIQIHIEMDDVYSIELSDALEFGSHLFPTDLM